ncbi:hypothetical protein [Escherichia sp. MOD1-EC6163]|uniref:hypothetical protein n=1 Tax=Escherichia sp. MOD1-EC6163 TaxID=2093896 RepID=UPI000CF7A3A4|nr:hypothetical protein [Escherichia sp. MOD1-EC6163]
MIKNILCLLVADILLLPSICEAVEMYTMECSTLPVSYQAADGAYTPRNSVVPSTGYTPKLVIPLPEGSDNLDYIYGYTYYTKWSGWQLTPSPPPYADNVISELLKTMSNPFRCSYMRNGQWVNCATIAPNLTFNKIDNYSYAGLSFKGTKGDALIANRIDPIMDGHIKLRKEYRGSLIPDDKPYNFTMTGWFWHKDVYEYHNNYVHSQLTVKYQLQCTLNREFNTELILTPSELTCPNYVLGTGVKECGAATLTVRNPGKGHNITVNLEGETGDSILLINTGKGSDITVTGTPQTIMPSSSGSHILKFKVDTNKAQQQKHPANKRYAIKFTSTWL